MAALMKGCVKCLVGMELSCRRISTGIDSGDVDSHLPLFDDAKGSSVGRLLGSGAAASQPGWVAACYNFETGSRGGMEVH